MNINCNNININNNNTNSSDCDETIEINNSQMITTPVTVIPPTTIVCLPSIVSVSSQQSSTLTITTPMNSGGSCSNSMQSICGSDNSNNSNSNSSNSNSSSIQMEQQNQHLLHQTIYQAQQQQQQLQQQHQQQNLKQPILITSNNNNNNRLQTIVTSTTEPSLTKVVAQQKNNFNLVQNQLQQGQVLQSQQGQRTAIVASSSSLPYLSLASNQPLRAVTNSTNQLPQQQHHRSKQSTKSSGGRGGRSNNNKPPPGAVNLERSYQICQAVIQNSPNRHQLRCQLRPPPSMLSTSNATQSQTATQSVKRDDQLVTSTSNRLVGTTNSTTIPRFPKRNFGQRQPSPSIVRQVIQNQGGIPVSLAVLPSGGNGNNGGGCSGQQMIVQHFNNSNDGSNSPQQMTATVNHVGQYVLVQRAGIGESTAPRASSAPPAQNQVNFNFIILLLNCVYKIFL